MSMGANGEVYANDPALQREVQGAVQTCFATTSGGYGEAAACINNWVDANHMRLTGETPGQPGAAQTGSTGGKASMEDWFKHKL